MNRGTVFFTLWAALLCAAVSSAAPLSPEVEFEQATALTMDFSTPHTDWAQPYAGGRTRVLVFTQAYPDLGRARECVELMQRFDMQVEAVYYGKTADSSKEAWYGGALGTNRIQKLIKQTWDCFVFLELKTNTLLASEHQLAVLQQVKNGAGLVFVGMRDEQIFNNTNMLNPMPLFLKAENIESAYNVLKGRGVQMTARPVFEFREGWQTEYDHWQERFGRAILWAAHREPQSQLDLKLAQPDGTALQATLSGATTSKDLHADLHIKRLGEDIAAFPVQPILKEQMTVFKLPRLPEGKYWADARVSGTNGVETWSAYSFSVPSSRAVTNVHFDKDWGEPGADMEGRIDLAGEARAGEALVIELRDQHRRILRREDVSLAKPIFRIKIEPWMPAIITVEAILSDAVGEMSQAYAYYYLPHRRHGRFNTVMWSHPGGPLAAYAMESLAQTDVTINFGKPDLSQRRMGSAYNMAWIFYGVRVTPHTVVDGVYTGICMPFSWSDDKAVRQHAAYWANRLAGAPEQGLFGCTIGDEPATQDCDLSEHDLEAYRRYLQKVVYGTIEALNASWKTRFKDWRDIELSEPPQDLTLDAQLKYAKSIYTIGHLGNVQFTAFAQWDKMPLSRDWFKNEEARSWEQKNYARWFDRQAFKSWNFMQMQKKYEEAFKTVDPQVKVGFDGAGHFDWGDDIDRIVRNTGFWIPYAGSGHGIILDEVIASIAPRYYPHGNWLGYQKDAESLLRGYWRMVTRGMNTVAFWRWDGIGKYHGWLAPDYRPFPAIQEMLKDTQIVRDGIGDLLMQSEKSHDGIGILFSYPSTFACKLENGASYGEYQQAHESAIQLVRGLGLQFRYVTDRMLKQGEFDTAKFKVLLLPRAEAIGDKEAEVIESFVRNGGTVIADIRPGVFDDHCNLRSEGVLDRLFGVQRPGLGVSTNTATIILPSGVSITNVALDGQVRLTGGKMLATSDGAPAVIAAQVGKGRAILLNFPFQAYPSIDNAETPEAAAEFFAQLIEQAGIKPSFALKDGSGQRLRNVELARWKTGAVQILALWRSEGKEEDAELILPGQAYAFDLRNRKALGLTDTVKTRILPGRATFYALLPTKPPTLNIAMQDREATRWTKFPRLCKYLEMAKATLLGNRVKRGSVVEVLLSVPNAAGQHAFRVNVSQAGKNQALYNEVIIAGREPVSFSFPVAWNDPLGTYRINVQDLYTSQVVTETFDVK